MFVQETGRSERPLYRNVRVAMQSLSFSLGVSISLGLALVPCAGYAADGIDASAPQNYNLAAGPLGRNLALVATGAGLALSFDPALTDGRISPALSGSYSLREALNRLLSGSGLELVPRADKASYTLQKRATDTSSVSTAATDATLAALPLITITGHGDGTSTEGTGSYTSGSSNTAMRMQMSIRETPQSVSIITRARMDDMGLNRLDDALAQTTGIMVGQYDSERTNYYARGFSISNIQIDGMPQGSNSPLQDTILYDRVEVVRGATGLMGGTGDPSAAINMIRKRPAKTLQGSAGLVFSRWNNRRAEVDVSVPLTADGRVRARTALAYQERDSYLDMYHERKKVGMVIVEADLTPSTLLTAGYDFQKNTPTGATWGAVPYWNADGSLANLPRNTSLSTPWSTWQNEQNTLFTSVDQRLGGGWKLHAGLARTTSRNNTTVAYAGSGYPDPATGTGMSLWTGVWGEGKSVDENFDLYATGPFKLFGRSHTLIAGWNGGNLKAPSYGGTATVLYSAEVPDYRTWTGDIPEPTFTPDGSRTEDHTHLTGAYLAGRFSVTDALNLIVGARNSTYRTETREFNISGIYTGTSGFSETRNEVTPYVGVVYDFSEHYSLYGSYTTLFNPQSYKDAENHFLKPETGTNSELGVKGEFMDGRLNASSALFYTKKKNLAELDRTVAPGFLLPDGSSAYSANAAGVTAKGIEFDVSGQLTPAWNVNAGYTYLHAAEATGERAVPDQPRHLVRLSSAYRFDGALSGLRVGGGVTAQSAIYGISWYGQPPAFSATPLARIPQSGYALYNVMAGYDITAKTSVQLNVSNLFDKKYYRNVGFYDSVYWGEPRNVTLTLRTKF